MKKILFKAFEEDGKKTYVYELPEEAELDEDTLDLCEDGLLKGIVPMEYVDDADAFYYDVTGYKTLGKALSGEVDSSDVLEALYGLARILVELKENNIPFSHLILHKDFIFIDRMTMEVKFLCVPLEEAEAVNTLEDVSRFVRVLLSGLTYDISEDGSYVMKLITLVNTQDQFNISIFVNVLQDLMLEYGVHYEEIAVSEAYAEYEDIDDIATIDTSILESMPESVTVAEMEAEALRNQAEAEAEAYEEAGADDETEAYAEKAEADDETEAYAEEAGADDEAEAYAEKAEADDETEAYAEEAEADDETEAYAEEAEADVETEEAEADIEEPVAEKEVVESAVGARADTIGSVKKGKFAKKSSGAQVQAVEEKSPASETEIKSDAEMKKMQQEALRKIAEAEKLDSFPGKKKSLDIDIEDMTGAIDEEPESEEGNTEALKSKEKPHKLELAKETIVRPVFDSVFEPIIESIDGPIDGDELPRAYVTTVPKPAKNPAKSAKAARAKLKNESETAEKRPLKTEKTEEEDTYILNHDVSEDSESSLLSQLDNAESLPKVNPYLIRVNNEERIMITKASFKIGKASFGMDYTVTDNGAISRNHCLIFAKDGVYYIRDNKSTNHTYVNGQIVKNGQDVLLTHESTIRIADEDFLFKLR